MKVRVVKAWNDELWYANRIGETFDAVEDCFGGYSIVGKKKIELLCKETDITTTGYSIHKSDCEVIPDEQPQFNIGDTVEIQGVISLGSCVSYGRQGKIAGINNEYYSVKFENLHYGNFAGKNLKLIKRQSTDNPPTVSVDVNLKLSVEQAKMVKNLMAHMGEQQIAYVLSSTNNWKPEVHRECHKLASDIYCELRDKLEVLG